MANSELLRRIIKEKKAKRESKEPCKPSYRYYTNDGPDRGILTFHNSDLSFKEHLLQVIELKHPTVLARLDMKGTIEEHMVYIYPVSRSLPSGLVKPPIIAYSDEQSLLQLSEDFLKLKAKDWKITSVVHRDDREEVKREMRKYYLENTVLH